MIAFIALLAFQTLPIRSQPRRDKHVQSLVTALVELQKAQCYFSSAIQIAPIMFVKQMHSGAVYDLLDANLLHCTHQRICSFNVYSDMCYPLRTSIMVPDLLVLDQPGSVYHNAHLC